MKNIFHVSVKTRRAKGFEDVTNKAQIARVWSLRINWLVERVCVALLLVLVLDVWLGVLVRYVIPLPLTFTEELARYLMIWMSLLAVSSGIAYREHIGVEFIFGRLPAPVRRWLAVAFDVIAFAFFAALFFYGIGFAVKGFSRLTMIYDIPKGYPFMGVPLAALMACIQLALIGLHDFFAEKAPAATGATMAGDE
ncbi:TRAP transporter small permease [Thalassovita mangrovi]|uniref:TRAP transporter small permease protein n=1 Tax=Thalassovita mangrovi TaxID=2692236 RepID=A0A6L8LLL9_9RHOB|nr:TRAP transporter small permease [Thalassovita mangrovi]MYM56918.1 TRAP transporter small permease subunit [Thalassovita mangrovi]